MGKVGGGGGEQRYFPNFFKLKQEISLPRGAYFTQAITRLIHLRHPYLKSSYICSGILFLYFSLIGSGGAGSKLCGVTHTKHF